MKCEIKKMLKGDLVELCRSLQEEVARLEQQLDNCEGLYSEMESKSYEQEEKQAQELERVKEDTEEKIFGMLEDEGLEYERVENFRNIYRMYYQI